MKKPLHFFFVCLLGIASIGTLSFADEPVLNSSHPDSYTVVKGDTLWDISKRFLDNPWMWPEIWHVNPSIKNPHLIYPGDVINLIYINGKPRLVVERSRDIRLSPSIRVEPLESAIPAIPLDKISAFLSKSRIVTDKEYEEAAYVVAGASEHIIVGPGDKLYARGDLDSSVSTYGIYRRGENYVDPETKELLGIQARDIGTGKVIARNENVSTLVMNRVTKEVRIEDRLLPSIEYRINSTFFPSAPSSDLSGIILAVEGGVTQIGRMDVVVLNRGSREGLEVGNVLAVYKKALLVKDRIKGDMVLLPEEKGGLLMVFRTFEKMSYAIVLSANQQLNILDTVRNP